MNLEGVEDALAYLRRARFGFYYPTGVTPLQTNMKNRVDNHENYDVYTLFAYINSLRLTLFVNGVMIENPVQLGEFFVGVRQKCKMTTFKIQIKTGLTPARITNVEKGRRHERKTLLSYMTAFPPGSFDFELYLGSSPKFNKLNVPERKEWDKSVQS